MQNEDVPNDTDPEVQQNLYLLLSTLSPEERLARMLNLCTFGRKMMLEDIKQKNPQASDRELRRLFGVRLWGESFANKFL